jgi:hypothetical protein
MKCIDCKWYAGQVNDTYGVCKRYPQTANKSQQDWCGEFLNKIEVPKIAIKFEEPTEYERTELTEDGKVKIVFTEEKPKRGRKAKQ